MPFVTTMFGIIVAGRLVSRLIRPKIYSHSHCDKGPVGLERYPYFYRSQTKLAKVMFLLVSVILFTGGGGSPGPYPGGG